MYLTSFINLAIIAMVPSVCCWGNLGHQTMGYIAQNFVSDETAAWAQNILSNTSDSYLAHVATWADTCHYTSVGHFSEPFHFIDANDNSPSTCNVDYNRDCGNAGCSMSAIVNYTSRMQDSSLSSEQTMQALEFIVHFLGDITQPLHDEALEVGGNDIDVTFNGTSTNLHHIWDTGMLEKLVGGGTISDAQTWATTLTNEIQSGNYSSQKFSWTSGISLSDVKTGAMTWATDANKFVCNPVLAGGDSAVENGDLGGDYYKAAVPIFSEQFAKGGYRLAAWLELLATGSTDL